ncbi:MAG: hypothetical protein QNL04_02770 [SAR324 cluster bacterium]|nr:hypothetical protein [SAR324 cluster bacterium]
MNAQQLELIAIQAGDALKYETSIKEIKRAAQSVFFFQKKRIFQLKVLLLKEP